MADFLRSSSRFSATPPTVDIQRSRFDRSSNVKTTFSAGKLIPFFVDEVLPGDTFDMRTSMVVRMSTPIYPVMDDCYLDYYYFYVPNRLVWQNWERFCGQNDVSAWTSDFVNPLPSIQMPAESDLHDTVADYFGLPTTAGLGGNTLRVTTLPFRAYQLIFNEWFRDENLQDPVLVNKTDTGDVWDTINTLLPVNKSHDYFTSALPAPQKGPSTLIPGAAASGTYPVTFGSERNPSGQVHFSATSGSISSHLSVQTNSAGLAYGASIANGSGTALTIDNAVVNFSGSAGGATINDLRQAYAIQSLLERDARGGTRYTELLRSHFGVVSPDSRLQRPEYLGGDRIYINMQQVVQQSSTDTTSPQGNVSGLSKTVHTGGSFVKSFTEHGYLIGVCCVRTRHTYQYGVNRLWSRRLRTDFYYPELANIGEQAILNKEIYAQGTTEDDEVFGYQEAWAEYRYKPSIVTGAFRHTSADGTLDSWHYADVYTSLPRLSDEWIRETDVNINRTLAVESSVSDQFLADIYIQDYCTRPMPLYSVPGLAGHM